MVTGRIRQKRQYYHMVLRGETFKDKNISTGIEAKNDKSFEMAKQMLDKTIMVFDENKLNESIAVINEHITEGTLQTAKPLDIAREIKDYGASHETDDVTEMYYADYILYWLNTIKKSIKTSTYGGYFSKASLISEYFRKNGNPIVNELAKKQIQDYITYLSEVKQNGSKNIAHHRGIIISSLNYIEDELDKNPARKISIPAKKKPKHIIRTADEIMRIIEYVLIENDLTLAWAIYAGGFLSYRREESMGASWPFIDLEKGIISVYHTITETFIKGEGNVLEIKDEGKTPDSLRSHYLDEFGIKLLATIKENQENNRQVAGSSYNYDYDQFVMVDSLGQIIMPETLSKRYIAIQKKMGFDETQPIKDLRHSCASDLNSRGKTLKDIQDYLGHSNSQITSTTYTYLFLDAKINVANENTDRLSHLKIKPDLCTLSDDKSNELTLKKKNSTSED